jgi:hypothetical protein
VEPVVFRYLKLLKYVQQINLSPEETLALIRRLETDSCGPEDDEVLIRVVGAHAALSADDLAVLPDLEQSLPVHPGKGKRPGAKRTRRRQRR